MSFTANDVLSAFVDFGCTAGPGIFTNVFGKYNGQHLWNKFVDSNYRLDAFYTYLDSDNRSKLSEYLESQLSKGNQE